MQEATEKIVEATKGDGRNHQVRREKELKEVRESNERGAVSN
jgi:hypothetical protein